MLVLGLMSGTSMDAIDAALTDVWHEQGGLRVQLRRFTSEPYSDAAREALFRLLDSDTKELARTNVRDVGALNFLLGEEFARAALAAMASGAPRPALIASHGQTIYHLVRDDGRKPFARSTLQVGEPTVIAERTGITCVADFRVADVAAGGQGAPLVPFLDATLFAGRHEPIAVVNIGGIANVTLLPGPDAPADVVAFDTGPGNMLIDRAARTLFGQPMDRQGAIAAGAQVNATLLDWLLGHPFFKQQPPKTTGHEDFGAAYYGQAWQTAQDLACDAATFIATLTELTARTIAAAIPAQVRLVILSGGGAHNTALLDRLRTALDRRELAARVVQSDEFGVPIDAKEAMAFALLGFEAVRGQSNNVPAATGARRGAILGKIVPGANYAALMREIWA